MKTGLNCPVSSSRPCMVFSMSSATLLVAFDHTLDDFVISLSLCDRSLLILLVHTSNFRSRLLHKTRLVRRNDQVAQRRD